MITWLQLQINKLSKIIINHTNKFKSLCNKYYTMTCEHNDFMENFLSKFNWNNPHCIYAGGWLYTHSCIAEQPQLNLQLQTDWHIAIIILYIRIIILSKPTCILNTYDYYSSWIHLRIYTYVANTSLEILNTQRSTFALILSQ